MQVSEVMHKGVVTAQISDSLKRVANLMKTEDIGALPVYKNERPVGFVTDRDIVISCVANGYSCDESVSHAMKKDIRFVKESQDINEALKIMEHAQISRLLVVDEGERPVGMLSLKDIGDHIEDSRLKSEIISEIKR